MVGIVTCTLVQKALWLKICCGCDITPAHQSVKVIATAVVGLGKLTTRLFWTRVPATNSYRSRELVKMKLWLQVSGKLGHRCTVNSNEP